ncbi:uncharacterized protein LOC113562175 [Ooceraea biroi]|uniref:uncharacterized protein LOC113562175 n=1 Tax=Ooceraea biroi TaxID=2015173 RepID=UPI000F094FEF|nr:uncharacterized protein LOC113562175 [Ooceraea biroi]
MTMVDMLIFFLLASQAINTFGKTIVLREENNARERKLTCFSEDDGSALVWNDVISEESLKKSRLIRFYNVDQIKPDKNKIDCKMKKSDECLKSWITKQWNFTESFITPLGPVFDKRWEGKS